MAGDAARGRPIAARKARRSLPVLMYHSVSRPVSGPLRGQAVPPWRLAEQLRALTDAGYRLVGLSEALDLLDADADADADLTAGPYADAHAETGTETDPGARAPLVALTFDDGYRNFLTDGLPRLAAAGGSATLYPVAGSLGANPRWLGARATELGPLLSASQLAEVVAAGIEIGSHGLAHEPLDVLPAAAVERELVESRDRLEQAIGRPVRSFCYPHGYHTHRMRALVRRAGYDNACEVGRRIYRPAVAPSRDDRFAIPRLQVTPDHSGPDLVDLVRGGGPHLVPRIKRLAQPGWRVTRRVARRLGHRLT